MKHLRLTYLLVLATAAMISLMIAGCVDPGPVSVSSSVVAGRLVVYNSSIAPPMDDPRDDIWSEAVAAAITVGDTSIYTDDFGEGTVYLRAIKAGNRLYLRAEWGDVGRSIYPNGIVQYRDTTFVYDTTYEIDTTSYNPLVIDIDTIITAIDTSVSVGWVRLSSTTSTTTYDTTLTYCDSVDADADTCVHYIDTLIIDTTINIYPSSDQDRFAIMWDVGDNGDYTAGGEGADCRSMCHSRTDLSVLGHRMYTTGGGHVDVWQWQAGTTDPVFFASDEYWSGAGREKDAGDSIFTSNYDDEKGQPIFAHKDTTAFTGASLHVEDTLTYNSNMPFPAGYEMPGYVLHDNATGSSAAIARYSYYNVGSRWAVVMNRALSTGHADDIDLSGIAPGDSVLVTIAIMNDADQIHSGSRPFYVIFP